MGLWKPSVFEKNRVDFIRHATDTMKLARLQYNGDLEMFQPRLAKTEKLRKNINGIWNLLVGITL